MASKGTRVPHYTGRTAPPKRCKMSMCWSWPSMEYFELHSWGLLLNYWTLGLSALMCHYKTQDSGHWDSRYLAAFVRQLGSHFPLSSAQLGPKASLEEHLGIWQTFLFCGLIRTCIFSIHTIESGWGGPVGSLCSIAINHSTEALVWSLHEHHVADTGCSKNHCQK